MKTEQKTTSNIIEKKSSLLNRSKKKNLHVLESFSISPLFYNTSSTNVFFSIFCGMGEKKRELKNERGRNRSRTHSFTSP